MVRDGGDKPPIGMDASSQDASMHDASMDDASADASMNDASADASQDNQPPEAYDDTVGVNEDGPAVMGDVPVATDGDGEIDVGGYEIADEIESGMLVFNDDGSYVFDPNGAFEALRAGQVRSLSFRYTARDDDGAQSAPATIEVTVNGANDAPQLVAALGDSSATAGRAYSRALPAGTFGDVDSGDTLTWSASGLPGWLSFDATTRTLHGTPQEDDVGTADVTITVTDGSDATAQDSFVLTVRALSRGSVVEQYTYDAAGRLTQVNYGGGRTVGYAYDRAGNVLKQEVVVP